MSEEAKMRAETARRALLQYGVRSLSMRPWGETGVDDKMFLLPERPLLIEFKVPGEERFAKQRWWHEQFKLLKYDTITCHGVEEALEAIRARLRERGY